MTNEEIDLMSKHCHDRMLANAAWCKSSWATLPLLLTSAFVASLCGCTEKENRSQPETQADAPQENRSQPETQPDEAGKRAAIFQIPELTEGPISLKEAVATFNAITAKYGVGKSELPLTEEEVVAAIRGWVPEQESHPPSKKVYEEYQKIGATGKLPKGAHFTLITGSTGYKGYDFDVWWIDLYVETGGEKQHVFRIRNRFLRCRPAGRAENLISPPATSSEKKPDSALRDDAVVIVDNAITQAQSEKKRVLLLICTSTCLPCRYLDRLLPELSPILTRHLVVVKLNIDVVHRGRAVHFRYRDMDHPGDRYIPWYVVLDEKGKPLITSDGPKGETGCALGPDSDRAYFLHMLRETAPGMTDEEINEIDRLSKACRERMLANASQGD